VRERYVTVGDRNRFAAITYEPDGTSSTPRAFSQAFPSGELWAVTTEFFVRRDGALLIPTVNVKNICGRFAGGFLKTFVLSRRTYSEWHRRTILSLGAIGLSGAVLGINRHGMSEPKIEFRRVLNDASTGA
jgi:hypothetical protein